MLSKSVLQIFNLKLNWNDSVLFTFAPTTKLEKLTEKSVKSFNKWESKSMQKVLNVNWKFYCITLEHINQRDLQWKNDGTSHATKHIKVNENMMKLNYFFSLYQLQTDEWHEGFAEKSLSSSFLQLKLNLSLVQKDFLKLLIIHWNLDTKTLSSWWILPFFCFNWIYSNSAYRRNSSRTCQNRRRVTRTQSVCR